MKWRELLEPGLMSCHRLCLQTPRKFRQTCLIIYYLLESKQIQWLVCAYIYIYIYIYILQFTLTSLQYLYRCTVHSVVYLINPPTCAHIFIYLPKIHIKTLKMLPEDDRMIETCRIVLSVLMWILDHEMNICVFVGVLIKCLQHFSSASTE